jgi:ABC-type nitrate/sulfonate/bicarbonate transport system permease component
LRIGSLVAIVLATLVAACGSSSNPTTPTPTQITDTLTGTVNQNGAVVQTFTTTTSGTVTATLTTLAPVSTITVGFALGTYNGTTCQVVLDNPLAVQGSILTGTAQTAGTFCARVYDIGNITADSPITFTVTVTHF